MMTTAAPRLSSMPHRKRSAAKSSDLEARRAKQAQLNLRVTDFAHDLLMRIAEKHGMTKTGALEYSIRQTARAEGVYDTPSK